MSNDKSIYRREDPTPYEKIVVNRIESDKKKEERSYQDTEKNSKMQTPAILISWFNQLLTLLVTRDKKLERMGSKKQFSSNIFQFKTLLETLSQEDLSHDPVFTMKLTLCWHELIEDCKALSANDPSFAPLFENALFFMNQVHNYPLGADHSLGYYFTQYAGQEWIPFPFMELLEILHAEHQKNPINSTLSNWISLLKEIQGLL